MVPIKEDKSIGNGDLHPYDKWEILKKDLYVKFQGATLAPGFYEGAYSDPDTGKMVMDSSRKYIVALKKEELNKLKKYLRDVVGPMFRQKCIYFEVKGEVELIESNLNKLDLFP